MTHGRWYEERRQGVREVFSRSLPGDSTVHESPSIKYRLEVTSFSTGPDTWSYSRGRVFRRGENEPLAEVFRNYSHFPFSWCENHPSGNGYLVCGEDYLGQTIIELNSGRRVDYIEETGRNGSAFCWVSHYPSPDGNYLFVDGCHWADEYELVLFDFRVPMSLPYREIKRWSGSGKVEGFQPDGSFIFETMEEVRKSDGKPLSELSDEENAELHRSPRLGDVVTYRRNRIQWRMDGRDERTLIA